MCTPHATFIKQLIQLLLLMAVALIKKKENNKYNEY